MPTYDYKCNTCSQPFVATHSIKEKTTSCVYCGGFNTVKTISPFAAKTENSGEHIMRKYEEQAVKDRTRFEKDDKFAANITGADDPHHEKKLDNVLKEQDAKNQKSLGRLKRMS